MLPKLLPKILNRSDFGGRSQRHKINTHCKKVSISETLRIDGMPQEILTTEFQDRSHKPLGHPSIMLNNIAVRGQGASPIKPIAYRSRSDSC